MAHKAGPPLSGPVPTPQGKYAKITLYLKKLPHITDDYFHAYLANNHVAPALRRADFHSVVRRYNQYHISPATRAEAAKFGLPVLEYDAVAEIWVDSVDDWIRVVGAPDFIKECAGDEENFVVTPLHVMVGFDNIIVGEEWQPKQKL